MKRRVNFQEEIDKLANQIASLSSEKIELYKKQAILEAKYHEDSDNIVSEITEIEEKIEQLKIEKSNLFYDESSQ